VPSLPPPPPLGFVVGAPAGGAVGAGAVVLVDAVGVAADAVLAPVHAATCRRCRSSASYRSAVRNVTPSLAAASGRVRPHDRSSA
jgi:hypothetical protein